MPEWPGADRSASELGEEVHPIQILQPLECQESYVAVPVVGWADESRGTQTYGIHQAKSWLHVYEKTREHRHRVQIGHFHAGLAELMPQRSFGRLEI